MQSGLGSLPLFSGGLFRPNLSAPRGSLLRNFHTFFWRHRLKPPLATFMTELPEVFGKVRRKFIFRQENSLAAE